MPHIVTRICRECKHTACVSVCPVDCFYIPNKPSGEFPDQLYISPEECIDCLACIPECPWEAIFEQPDVPEIFAGDIKINALSDSQRDNFKPAEEIENPMPEEEDVIANKKKWGYEDEDA